jgi:hypothetical protein
MAISRVVFGLRDGVTAQRLLTGWSMKPAKSPRRNTAAPVVDLTATARSLKSDPRLPHERDEKAGAAVAPPRPKIKRAYKDLASGQVDTDCRNAAAQVIKKKSAAQSRAARKR